MQTIYIQLPNVSAVQNFASVLANLPGQFDLTSEQYILDARSMMGILSLDLTKPLRLTINEATPAAMQALAPFLADIEQAAAQEVPHGK